MIEELVGSVEVFEVGVCWLCDEKSKGSEGFLYAAGERAGHSIRHVSSG